MNIFILFAMMTLGLNSPKEPIVNDSMETKTESIIMKSIDMDFLKKELQEAVLEFVDSTGIDRDSIYIPFTKELPLKD